MRMNRAVMLGLALACLSVVPFVPTQETGTATAASNMSPVNDAVAGAKGFSDKGFCYGKKDLTASERAGCAIWFYATAGNSRFFTYVYQQRLGVLIDWFWVLNSADRDKRFARWGMINDPECCKPGDPNCPAKSYDETYGFDYCPGDQKLLQYVGKAGYRDPACDFIDAPLAEGQKDQRQNPCDLEFGTSTGMMGIRKFPNPRFNADQWRKVNGQLGTWAGYNQKVKMRPESPYPDSRMLDGSIEPPFLIGASCGSCHIAFDPLKPPRDPRHPGHENISGTVGNQYSRFSQILASGMNRKGFEWQVFGHARPGIVDTSALPNDQINNSGTINALINLEQRPKPFEHEIVKWRPAKQCPMGADGRSCWCEPGKDGKCWERSRKKEPVNQILKGGEDSIGALEAIQRVYFNIGSCSEEAWVNHLMDMRQIDSAQRGYGQTPFEIGQARRDCAQFRAIEDRLQDTMNFLLTARPSDLYEARGLKTPLDLVEQLEQEFGKDAVRRGKLIFAQNCARCHSSQKDPSPATDFHKLKKDGKGRDIREDWLGSDEMVPVSEVGTNRSRALHSNHMKGHIWDEYGSETLRSKPGDPNIKEPSDGGRGYYRNISLLSVWAHAPFMHNNAIGPEIYGGADDVFYNSPYVQNLNGQFVPIPTPPSPWEFNPSVEGRYKLFKASMHELLNPRNRVPKVSGFENEVQIYLGPTLWLEKDKELPINLTLTFPKGTPSAKIGNFRYKSYLYDLWSAKHQPEDLAARYKTNPDVARTIRTVAEKMSDDPGNAVLAFQEGGRELSHVYSNSTAIVENEGHRFGEDLSPADKDALIAFLATL